MILAAARLRAFAGSLTGQLVLILTIGLASSSIVSLLLAERARIHDFSHVRMERVVASTADMARRFEEDPDRTAALLRENHILGAREVPAQWHSTTIDPELSKMLVAQLGPSSDAQAVAIPRNQCFPNFDIKIRAAGMSEFTLPDCWYVRFRDSSGTVRRLSIDLASFHIPPSSTLDPLYLALIVAASTALSFVVAFVAGQPLRRLTEAARAFSVTVDPEPIPVGGPREVRAALETFNLMQHRVREGFRERTQILASVTHDLQTPLTRLRLRLEQVNEPHLRKRLIADLAVMQQLVRDGLELARSSESREPWSIVEIDSILTSVAEDAAEAGDDVRHVFGVPLRERVKPNALSRCIANLVDNAVRYGGSAEIGARIEGDTVTIEVRDRGPGIEEAMLDQVFEPFRRLNPPGKGGVSGSGLGLAIARAQAQTFGATLDLSNHPGGGISARIRWVSDMN